MRARVWFLPWPPRLAVDPAAEARKASGSEEAGFRAARGRGSAVRGRVPRWAASRCTTASASSGRRSTTARARWWRRPAQRPCSLAARCVLRTSLGPAGTAGWVPRPHPTRQAWILSRVGSWQGGGGKRGVATRRYAFAATVGARRGGDRMRQLDQPRVAEAGEGGGVAAAEEVTPAGPADAAVERVAEREAVSSDAPGDRWRQRALQSVAMRQRHAERVPSGWTALARRARMNKAVAVRRRM